MNDLISRQAAIDALDTLAESYADDTEDDYFTGCYSGVNRSIDAIKALPSAQPEIIRCKDCKYCMYTPATPNANRKSEGHHPERWNCFLYLHEHHPLVTPNDFCSRAERREVTT